MTGNFLYLHQTCESDYWGTIRVLMFAGQAKEQFNFQESPYMRSLEVGEVKVLSFGFTT